MEGVTIKDFKYKGSIENKSSFCYNDIYLNILPKISTELVEIWEITGKDKMNGRWVWASQIESFTPNPHFK